MMTGFVNSRKEAVLRLTVVGESSLEHGFEAVVDTGFDGWLSLPPSVISLLGLQSQRIGRAILADGSEKVFAIYLATVLWDGEPRQISVYEMDADPLIGMSLMYGYELRLPVLGGASFTLRPID